MLDGTATVVDAGVVGAAVGGGVDAAVVGAAVVGAAAVGASGLTGGGSALVAGSVLVASTVGATGRDVSVVDVERAVEPAVERGTVEVDRDGLGSPMKSAITGCGERWETAAYVAPANPKSPIDPASTVTAARSLVRLPTMLPCLHLSLTDATTAFRGASSGQPISR